jgi:hypothetical protein
MSRAIDVVALTGAEYDALVDELADERQRREAAEKYAARLEAALRAECSKHGDFCLCERCRMVFAAPR